MHHMIWRTLIAGAALATFSAQAAEPEGSWYITPGAHGAWLDDARHADDDWAYDLSIGKAFTEHLNFEVSAFQSKHDGLGGDDLKLKAYGLNGLLVFYRDSRIEPYLLLGVGVNNQDRAISGNSSDMYADVGAGLVFRLTQSADCSRGLALRGDVRARRTFADQSDDFVDYFTGLGLQFYWGGKSCASTPEPEEAAPPPPPPPPPPAGPADSDHDGVTDDHDRCPGTAEGVKVDAVGCELDSDGDGVVDSKDKCPNTPAGQKVDAQGCPFEVKLEVLFDNDSSTIKPESQAYLDQVAARLNELPNITGVIEGHTDSNGDDAHNQSLSERRAKAVLDYLVSKGVAASRFTAKGYGESQPVADNSTADGRAQNRRVILKRTDQG